ncbi:protein O-mannose kinase-like [Branchiostoma floridae]|uniref:Protein O-mannose kinase n=1 Tax=Branchiostoma floridae TaxID=7739 RepID=A0A9J7ML61_BRAFL|nr:protein O-mannose kinase-like [Branchiostoma floridae]
MEECMPWLGCKEMANEVTVQKKIGGGALKTVYLATWRDYTVAYSNLTKMGYRRDFHNDVEKLRKLQHSSHIVTLVGSCNTTLLTEYHRLGPANHIETILKSKNFSKFNDVRTRFNLSLSFVEAIHFLHNSPIGTLVMCDQHHLLKTLSQYLITEDFNIVVNDLDSLKEVNSTAQLLIRCRQRQLRPGFVSPEELWPFENETFDGSRLPYYDEKTDIWKIPNVVNYLLGKVNGSDVVRSHLFKVHRRCQNRDPKQRPSANVLLEEYKRVRNLLFT